MESRYFGKSKVGENATLYTLRNSRGMVMTVTDYGATLHSLLIPVGNELRDVVLGYDDPAGYDGPAALTSALPSAETPTASAALPLP